MKISKHLTNLELAKLLRAVSAALELSGANSFRFVAYQKAADAIEHSSSEVKDLWDDKRLGDLPGVGESIASHLDELFRTGKVKHFESIFKPFPPSLFEMLEVPGIGPKTAYKLSKSLGISRAHSAISSLEKAAKKGKIRNLEGFGVESEADIIRSIGEYKNRSRRMLLPVAQSIADSVIEWMQKSPVVKQADPLGSLRRQASTVGDVDIAVASADPVAAITHFTQYPQKSRVLEAGDKSASLILPNGYQVDLMVQPPESYGSLLQHFTGSKHHNIALRELALKKGLSLSEYGIKQDNKTHHFSSEEDFYHYLGLEWIPPELREGRGEIERAKNKTLPKLITVEEIKGDLQLHSSFDVEPSHDLGQSTPIDMARMGASLGYEYIGLTEHNPAVSTHTKKQMVDIIKAKTEAIAHINESGGKQLVHIFNGMEIDIQSSGERALPDEALELLDYACVSIHGSFRQNRKLMTDRVLRGLDHPKVRFFAHPTARLLNQREGIELDWDRIFDFCLTHNKWLEVDAWPNRLDLPDTLVHEAIKRGVRLVIDTDSHEMQQMEYMRFGVSVARRGHAQTKDIINTVSLTKMRELLKGGE